MIAPLARVFSVIVRSPKGHDEPMSRCAAALQEPVGATVVPLLHAVVRSDRVEPARTADGELSGRARATRLRRLFDDHYDFVWRYIRRLGLDEADADDAAQRVFLVVSRRLDDVVPSKERSFICGTALRVVHEHRRARGRRWERPVGDCCEEQDESAAPDDLADRDRARALLDVALGELPIDLRSVFVLFELEELPVAEIAALLQIPVGTAASRLRRARESFRAAVKRLRARGVLPGGDS